MKERKHSNVWAVLDKELEKISLRRTCLSQGQIVKRGQPAEFLGKACQAEEVTAVTVLSTWPVAGAQWPKLVSSQRMDKRQLTWNPIGLL